MVLQDQTDGNWRPSKNWIRIGSIRQGVNQLRMLGKGTSDLERHAGCSPLVVILMQKP